MSTVTLKFFARLREQTGTDELTIALEQASNLSQLKQTLLDDYPQWSPYLSGQILVAVNQTMVNSDQSLQAGDEVAWFPPVTGG